MFSAERKKEESKKLPEKEKKISEKKIEITEKLTLNKSEKKLIISKLFNPDIKVGVVIVILLLIALGYVIFYLTPFRAVCFDEQCFNSRYNSCQPVKFNMIKNGNYYTYTVDRSFFNLCNLNVKYVSSAPGTDFEIRSLLEGKGMSCKIPKSVVAQTDFSNLQNLLGYCTGPLKEGIYELIIKKMYTLVISNINDVLTKI